MNSVLLSKQRVMAASVSVLLMGMLWLPVVRSPRVAPGCFFDDETHRLQDFAEIDSEFQRKFAFRESLLTLYNRARFAAFGLPSRSVVLGADGYLFYDSDISSDGYGMSDFMGKALPDAATLGKWQKVMSERQSWLSAQGIACLCVVAPNKQTILPELLPQYLRYKRGTVARSDKALAVMRAHGGLPPVDVRQVLREVKKRGQVFLRTDTHWSELGGCLAYSAIIESLRGRFPDVSPIEFSNWTVTTRTLNGDIARMMRVVGSPTEVVEHFDPPTAFPAITSDGRPVLAPGWDSLVSEYVAPEQQPGQLVLTNPQGRAGVLLVFHDSFGATISQFLGQHFARTVFVWGRFDRRLVEALKPVAVVHEQVERYVDRFFEEQ